MFAVLILLLLATLVRSQCGGLGYDLSLLVQDLSFFHTPTSYTYYYHPCGSVNYQYCPIGSMLCRVLPNGQGGFSSISQSTYSSALTHYSYPDTPSGVIIGIQNGPSIGQNPSTKMYFEVRYQCDMSTAGQIVSLDLVSILAIAMTVNTSVVCGPGARAQPVQPSSTLTECRRFNPGTYQFINYRADMCPRYPNMTGYQPIQMTNPQDLPHYTAITFPFPKSLYGSLINRFGWAHGALDLNDPVSASAWTLTNGPQFGITYNTNLPVVAAFATRLVTTSGIDLPSARSTTLYSVEGVAPNRQLVVRISNHRFDPRLNDIFDTVSLDIIVYESGPAEIEIRYYKIGNSNNAWVVGGISGPGMMFRTNTVTYGPSNDIIPVLQGSTITFALPPVSSSSSTGVSSTAQSSSSSVTSSSSSVTSPSLSSSPVELSSPPVESSSSATLSSIPSSSSSSEWSVTSEQSSSTESSVSSSSTAMSSLSSSLLDSSNGTSSSQASSTALELISSSVIVSSSSESISSTSSSTSSVVSLSSLSYASSSEAPSSSLVTSSDLSSTTESSSSGVVNSSSSTIEMVSTSESSTSETLSPTSSSFFSSSSVESSSVFSSSVSFTSLPSDIILTSSSSSSESLTSVDSSIASLSSLSEQSSSIASSSSSDVVRTSSSGSDDECSQQYAEMWIQMPIEEFVASLPPGTAQVTFVIDGASLPLPSDFNVLFGEDMAVNIAFALNIDDADDALVMYVSATGASAESSCVSQRRLLSITSMTLTTFIFGNVSTITSRLGSQLVHISHADTAAYLAQLLMSAQANGSFVTPHSGIRIAGVNATIVNTGQESGSTGLVDGSDAEVSKSTSISGGEIAGIAIGVIAFVTIVGALTMHVMASGGQSSGVAHTEDIEAATTHKSTYQTSDWLSPKNFNK